MKGIDVSKHQGKINWNLVKNNINFAILRIGYGMYNSQKDKQFERNYSECKRLGIPMGVYHYSYAKNIDQAKKEANLVLNWLKDKELQLPVYFDIEDNSQSGLGKEMLTNMCIAFCETIENAGLWAGVYANKYWFNSLLNREVLESKYTIWVAQYYNKCTYNGKYDIWQYTSSGRINGINGNVDMNYMYRDLISEIGNKTSNKTNIEVDETNENVQEEPIINNELNYKKFVSTNNIIYSNISDAKNKKNAKTLSRTYYNKQIRIVKVYENVVLAEGNLGFFNFDDIRIVDNAQAVEITHKVIAGDTLNELAEKYNTTVDNIADLNNIEDENKIYIGQVLKINSSVFNNSTVYVVKDGDTLSEIAERYNTTVSNLISKNNIKNQDYIYAGQKINI